MWLCILSGFSSFQVQNEQEQWTFIWSMVWINKVSVKLSWRFYFKWAPLWIVQVKNTINNIKRDYIYTDKTIFSVEYRLEILKRNYFRLLLNLVIWWIKLIKFQQVTETACILQRLSRKRWHLMKNSKKKPNFKASKSTKWNLGLPSWQKIFKFLKKKRKIVLMTLIYINNMC